MTIKKKRGAMVHACVAMLDAQPRTGGWHGPSGARVWSQNSAGPVGHGCGADHGDDVAVQLKCNYFLARPGDPGYPGEGRARA